MQIWIHEDEFKKVRDEGRKSAIEALGDDETEYLHFDRYDFSIGDLSVDEDGEIFVSIESDLADISIEFGLSLDQQLQIVKNLATRLNKMKAVMEGLK